MAIFQKMDEDGCSSFQRKTPCPVDCPGYSSWNKWVSVVGLFDGDFTGRVCLFSFLEHDSESNFGKYSIVLIVTWRWWNCGDCQIVLTWALWPGWREPFWKYSIFFSGAHPLLSFLHTHTQTHTHTHTHTHTLHSYQWIPMNHGRIHLNPASGISHTWISQFLPHHHRDCCGQQSDLINYYLPPC